MRVCHSEVVCELLTLPDALLSGTLAMTDTSRREAQYQSNNANHQPHDGDGDSNNGPKRLLEHQADVICSSS